MNGKFLDGELLLEICLSYQNAINSGSIPNIDSAWNSLCKSETLKAYEQAEKLLDQKLKEFSEGKYQTSVEMKILKKNVS